MNNYQSRVFLNHQLTQFFHVNYNMPVPRYNNFEGMTYRDFNLLLDWKPSVSLYDKNISEFMINLTQISPKIFSLWKIYNAEIASNNEFNVWFYKYGKKAYINYLLTNNFFIKDVIIKYYCYILFIPSFTNYNYLYNTKYTNGLSYVLITLGILFNNLVTATILLICGCLFSKFMYKKLIIPKSLIVVDVILLMGFFANSVIAFWGDGMEFSRHCMIPGMAINLIIIINMIYICYFSSIKTDEIM